MFTSFGSMRLNLDRSNTTTSGRSRNSCCNGLWFNHLHINLLAVVHMATHLIWSDICIPTISPPSLLCRPPYYPPQLLSLGQYTSSHIRLISLYTIHLWSSEWTWFWVFQVQSRRNRHRERRVVPTAFYVVVTIRVRFIIIFVVFSFVYCLWVNTFK